MEENVIEETFVKPNGEKVVKKYRKGKFLGKGTETECFELVCLENSKVYAGKIFSKARLKNRKLKQRLKTEVRIQSKLNHPNIVEFEKFFEDGENVYVLYELCANKNLLELLRRRKRLTEIEVHCYLLQLIASLKYLHSLKIIHRDLRLNNLFLTETLSLKLGDFSKSTKIEFEGERKKTLCGVPNFMAPEVIDGCHSYEADIWALGILFYTLLIGHPPFHTDSPQETYKKIKSGSFEYPSNVNLSIPAQDAIQQIFIVNWEERPTLDQILAFDFFVQMKDAPRQMRLATLVSPPQEFKNNNAGVHFDDDSPEQFRGRMQRSVFVGSDIEGEVYVRKWIDYSWKYGIGYLLSSRNCGVSFVDGTRMVVNGCTGQGFYMEKGSICEFSVGSVPEEMRKKVTLWLYFKKFLESEGEESTFEYDNRFPVYVKKWMATRHALVFRLSNRLVQVNFKDQSELSLNCDSKLVSFSNRKGEKLQMSLSKALQSTNLEILRRLKYTHDALDHMLRSKH